MKNGEIKKLSIDTKNLNNTTPSTEHSPLLAKDYMSQKNETIFEADEHAEDMFNTGKSAGEHGPSNKLGEEAKSPSGTALA